MAMLTPILYHPASKQSPSCVYTSYRSYHDNMNTICKLFTYYANIIIWCAHIFIITIV